ncbi:MAG: protein kinase domain-containing protein [Planctomycetaceae bacterium]
MALGVPPQKDGSARETVPPVAAPTSERRATAAASGAAVENDAADADWTDRMLGEFRILRRLGHGGMAEVFLAEQTSLKRNVAVKVLRQERVSDASYLKRFKTEAMAAAALSHPNIVQVYLIGEHEGTHFIAQEYVQGLNLREFLMKKGPPEQAVALKIMRQVASALQAAHAAGIVHRDIKPENILLTRKGEAKVGDFGLAQLTQQGERVNLTQVGVTMGTPLYMSPEQVHGKKLDARSDVYSFGVTCYHLLTGNPPFRGETAMSVAVQHLKEEPESLEQLRGDLSPLLCRIVRKMMAKEPQKRYQSADEILRDIKKVAQEGSAGADRALDAADIDAAETTDDRPWWRRLLSGLWHSPDWPVAKQLAAVLLLGVLVAGASAGVGWLSRPTDPFTVPPPSEPKIPRKDTILLQFLYARDWAANDIDAWQAVIDFSSGDMADRRKYSDLAKQRLAMLHLRNRQYTEAQAIFDEFATRTTQTDLQAFGLAGQAVVQSLRGDYAESMRSFERLSPANFSKVDAEMRAIATEMLRLNLREQKTQGTKELQALINDQNQQSANEPNGQRAGDAGLEGR